MSAYEIMNQLSSASATRLTLHARLEAGSKHVNVFQRRNE